MEHYFCVNVWRKKSFHTGKRKPKKELLGWFRSHDSSYPDWEGSMARIKSLNDFLRSEAGEFGDEHIITTRGGSYNWSWRNKTGDMIIEITKIDFCRVYDWDDVQPIE